MARVPGSQRNKSNRFIQKVQVLVRFQTRAGGEKREARLDNVSQPPLCGCAHRCHPLLRSARTRRSEGVKSPLIKQFVKPA